MNLQQLFNSEGDKKRIFGLLLGIILAVVVYFFLDFSPEHHLQRLLASVAALMAVWWITECIPLAATSLIPLVLFPFLGILSGKLTAASYINSTIFLFMGGFIIALAMEKWGLHKRIALSLIALFGKNPSQIILGFMIASAFISMWISNTATAVMLLPIGLAIVYKMEEQFGKEKTKKFSIALLLAIAYSCSVGGLGTLIGTPPNLVFQRVFSIQFPNKPEIVFSEWMIFAVPLSLVMLIIIWLLLTKVFFKISDDVILQKDVIQSERIKLGKMSYEEKVVLVVFTLTALLWIFRNDLEAGIFTLPGWSSLLPTKDFIDDGTIAIMMGLFLFIIPAKDKTKESSAILGNKIIRKIPWEIILLFGGGFALAEGFVSSGLSETIGAQFAGLQGMPIYLLILIICLSITFLTELTSNTATAQIILPILASLSIQLNLDPYLLMIPATLSASMAFMMPVATPPNAIIFGSDRIKVKDMARTGLAINFIGAFLISGYIYLIFG